MGLGIKVECKICDYQDTFLDGVGMMYSSLENVLFLVSPKRREKVLQILHSQKIHDVRYGHRLFQCPECKIIAGRFDFSILYNDGQAYTPYFRCSNCRKKLVLLDDQIEDVISNFCCPTCGEKSLTSFYSMIWD